MAGGVGGAEAQRVGGEQAQDREADPLLLEQLGAGGPRQRQDEVAYPQADDLGAADLGQLGLGTAEAEPGEPGLAVDLDRAAASLACSFAEPARRARTSAQLRRLGGGGLGDRQRRRVCHSGLTGGGRIEVRKL